MHDEMKTLLGMAVFCGLVYFAAFRVSKKDRLWLMRRRDDDRQFDLMKREIWREDRRY